MPNYDLLWVAVLPLANEGGGDQFQGWVMDSQLASQRKWKASQSAIPALAQVSNIQNKDKGGQTVSD